MVGERRALDGWLLPTIFPPRFRAVNPLFCMIISALSRLCHAAYARLVSGRSLFGLFIHQCRRRGLLYVQPSTYGHGAP